MAEEDSPFHSSISKPRTANTATVVIASTSFNKPSETFIRTHLNRLPFECIPLHGNNLDCTADDTCLMSFPPHRRAAYLLLRAAGHSQESLYNATIGRWLREMNARCVIAEYGFNAIRMIGPCQTAKVPLIAHFHGLDAHNRAICTRHREGYGHVFKHAAAIVGVSSHMCDRLRYLGAPPERLHRIPYWTDAAPAPVAPTPREQATFLSVGRFVQKKAPHLTLIAFARVVAEHPQCTLTMIGDGPLFPLCKDLAKGLGIENLVDFRGAQPHSVVNKHLSLSSCFIQHSVTASNGDSEGLPVAVLEAQKCGLPVVSTYHAGIPEIVEHDVTGFLVQEGDVSGMAHYMSLIASDATLRNVMGKQARERTAAEFSYSKTLGLLETLVEKCGGIRIQRPYRASSQLALTHSNKGYRHLSARNAD